jgi:hypothetical protein
MITLKETTEDGAVYEFTHATGSKTITFHHPDPAVNEAWAQEEHASWLLWLDVPESEAPEPAPEPPTGPEAEELNELESEEQEPTPEEQEPEADEQEPEL